MPSASPPCRRRHAGSHPLTVSVRPRLLSSPPPPPPTEADGDNLSVASNDLSPHRPAAALTLACQPPYCRHGVPCPSASALACRRRHVGSRPLPVSIHPHLPSLLPPPPPPLPSRCCPRHPVNLRCPASPQSLSPPSRLQPPKAPKSPRKLLGSTTCRGIHTEKKKRLKKYF